MKSRFGLVQVLAILVALCQSCATSQRWPSTSAALTHARSPTGTADDALVRSLPVCIASKVWSDGELGASVLYRYQRVGRRLTVGYFVYWTGERPWGANLLSFSVIPALLIDAFYSHLLFVFPGAQRILYGPGDVEGARITYEQTVEGRWVVARAVADNGIHQEVELASSDIVNADGAVVLTTDVWSHQLGARAGSESARDPIPSRCFAGASLSPLTDEVAGAFRLGTADDPRRAGPAWRLNAPAPPFDSSWAANGRAPGNRRPKDVASITR